MNRIPTPTPPYLAVKSTRFQFVSTRFYTILHDSTRFLLFISYGNQLYFIWQVSHTILTKRHKATEFIHMPKYRLVKLSIKYYLLLTQLQAWFLCIKVVCTKVNDANARNRNFLFLTYNFFSPPSTSHLVPVPRSFFQVESRLVKTAPPSFQ